MADATTSIGNANAVEARHGGADVADFIALLKPRVMSLVVFTALTGMIMAPGSLHPVLGLIALIGGFVVCGLPFLLGPVAWITGNGVKKDAAAAGYPEPGNNKGGRICGIVATAFLALAVVGIVLIVVAAAASNG